MPTPYQSLNISNGPIYGVETDCNLSFFTQFIGLGPVPFPVWLSSWEAPSAAVPVLVRLSSQLGVVSGGSVGRRFSSCRVIITVRYQDPVKN